MSARDNHRDVVRVFARDPILGAGVPNRIFGRKLAYPLDLRGAAGLVAIKTPMSDVAMMADPIKQLPAADIVIPAPIHVNARLNVWFHLGWSNPGIIFQFGWRRRDCDIPTRGAWRH